MMSKWTLEGILVGAIFILATTGVASGQCSDATLRGAYGIRQSGQLFFPTGTVQRDEVGIMQFDGTGRFSLDLFALNNGIIDKNFENTPGTYTVKSNCTGSAEINFPNGGIVKLAVVLSKRGKIVHFLAFSVIVPGNPTPVPVSVHGDGEKLDLNVN